MDRGGEGSNRGKQGFASMDPEKQRQIASKGGKASRGFESMDPQKQREIARKGGKASGRRRQ